MKAARIKYRVFELVRSDNNKDAQPILGLRFCEHNLLNGEYGSPDQALSDLQLLAQDYKPALFTVLPITVYIDHPHADIVSSSDK